MGFNCIVCKYTTTNKKYYIRHINTQKHDKNITKINKINKTKTCKNCCKEFIHDNSYYRHMKNNGKCVDKIKDTSNIKKTNDNNIKKNKIKTNSEKIDELMNKVDNINDNINFALKSSSSLINYLMKNYKHVEPIKKITDNECNLLMDTKYNNITNYKIQLDLVKKFKNKTLDEYIKDTILEFVLNNDCNKQQIWNSDASRLHYAIKLKIDLWHNDINGIQFNMLVINPILEYFYGLMKTYLEHLYEIHDKLLEERPRNYPEIDKHYNTLIETIEVYDYFLSPDTRKKFLKDLAPYLTHHNIMLNVHGQ